MKAKGDHRRDESMSPALDSLPLFAPRALSGHTDPQTSREAAARMVDSGALGEAQLVALREVRLHPGCTAPELGSFAVVELGRRPETEETWRQRIGRRLNELEKAGLIRREGVRDGCSVWWPV